jgi:adenylosuccinate synthase
LDTFDEVKVAVAYKLDGEVLKSAPGNLCVTNSVFTSVYLARAADWERVEVEYKTFPGWNSNTSDIRSYSQLPEACKNYIQVSSYNFSVNGPVFKLMCF